MAMIPSLVLLLAASFVNTPSGDILDQGFNDMYNLSFSSAHEAFQRFEALHPSDPVGPVCDAAAYLFSEFNRLKILQAQFFVDDRSYLGRARETPNTNVKQQFEQLMAHAKQLSARELAQSPNSENALFANVLRLGLNADYLALIEKQNLAALGIIKQATQAAQNLLRLDPTCYDAYIAIGIENYLLSLKPAPVRWFLHATGAHTDKQAGIQALRTTASKGHYLQPYASLLLAVAALRDNDDAEARRLLLSLAQRFPRNPLYREELKHIH